MADDYTATDRALQDMTDKLKAALTQSQGTGSNANADPLKTPTDSGKNPDKPQTVYVTTPTAATPSYTTPTLPGANNQTDYINSLYAAQNRAQYDSPTLASANSQADYIRSLYSTPEESYNAPQLVGANAQNDYINAIYEANRKAQEANLRSAYEQNMADLAYQERQLPQVYNAAANEAAAQAAIAQRNFNERAAGSGLNTGAASQAVLSQNNAMLGNLNSIRQAQANAQQQLALQRQKTTAEYRNAINAALAENDLSRAQALYSEAKRVDEANIQRANNQAQIDWTIYNTLAERNNANRQTLANALANEARRVDEANRETSANQAQIDWNIWNALYNANNQMDMSRLQALLNEAYRVDNANMNTAANQANMDWTVWNALYNKK